MQLDAIDGSSVTGLHVSEKEFITLIVLPVPVIGIPLPVGDAPCAPVMPRVAELTLFATVTETTAAMPFCIILAFSPARMHSYEPELSTQLMDLPADEAPGPAVAPIAITAVGE